MSLNNSQMLPARVRNMRQMNDVLNAEDIILAEIERIIDEMYQRASLLHEELINEEWLENKLSERTGAGVDVTGYAEKLLAEIVLDVSELQHIDMPDVRKFLDKWVPAHPESLNSSPCPASLKCIVDIESHADIRILSFCGKTLDGNDIPIRIIESDFANRSTRKLTLL